MEWWGLTLAEWLAAQAKHGARASAADMQRNPDGSFTGVVLCRYCSNDAAARAVNQLSKAVADGRALVAEYNLPPGAPGGGPTNAASPAPVAARAPARGSPVHRLVPAVPAVTPQALSRTSQRRRSRGYSEDWTSRRSSEVGSASKPARVRVRAGVCVCDVNPVLTSLRLGLLIPSIAREASMAHHCKNGRPLQCLRYLGPRC